MQKVIFVDSWSAFFAESGLKSFNDFFEHPAAETIGTNTRRSVTAFSLGADSQKKTFFMKRFFRPHFKDMLFTRRNLGESCSQGRYEWENARLLLDGGIDTYRPVCYGENTMWGLETKSFVVTEELQAKCLTDFVRQEWQGLQRQQKEKIMTELAAFVRRIHALNISLPDLYVCHIYLTENTDGGYDFTVIDLHRMSRNVTNKNRKIKNLGRLHNNMLDSYFDEKLKRLFIESYAANDPDSDVTALVNQVERYSNAVSTKRRQKQY